MKKKKTIKAQYLKACRYSSEYKGLVEPKCNGGNPCEACLAKWRERNGGSPVPDMIDERKARRIHDDLVPIATEFMSVSSEMGSLLERMTKSDGGISPGRADLVRQVMDRIRSQSRKLSTVVELSTIGIWDGSTRNEDCKPLSDDDRKNDDKILRERAKRRDGLPVNRKHWLLVERKTRGLQP